MPNKRKKGQTLNEFVLAEMDKYYIEKNSKNIKNMRNKINYLVATDPRLKKLKAQRDKATKDSHNGKVLPESYWKKIAGSAEFQKYAKKHTSKAFTKEIEDIEKEFTTDDLDDPEYLKFINASSEERDKMLQRQHQSSQNLITDTLVIRAWIEAIAKKVLPNTHLDEKQLNHDLNFVKHDRLKLNDDELFTYTRAKEKLKDLSNYIVADKKKY